MGDSGKKSTDLTDTDVEEVISETSTDRVVGDGGGDRVDGDVLENVIDQTSSLSLEEIEERRCKCLELKSQGNSKFKDNEHLEAIDLYTEAIEICPPKDTKEKSILYNNRAAAYSHLGDGYVDKCLEDCTQSIELDPLYVKPYLKRARTVYNNGPIKEKMDQAVEDFEKVIELEPSYRREIFPTIVELKGMIEKRNEELKKEMIGKLKDIGNVVLNKFGLSTDNFQLVQNPENGSYSVNFKK